MKNKAVLWISTALFLVLQIAIIYGLLGKGYLDFTRSVAVTSCIWVVYTLIEAKCNLFMNNYVRVVTMTAIICDAFFGYYLDYYETSFVFDKMLHAFGTYAFALFAYVLAVQLLHHPVSRVFKFILVASLGLSLGAAYELVEFLVDTFAYPIIPSQLSLLDTDLDMVCDTIGALFAAVHAVSKTFINKDF